MKKLLIILFMCMSFGVMAQDTYIYGELKMTKKPVGAITFNYGQSEKNKMIEQKTFPLAMNALSKEGWEFVAVYTYRQGTLVIFYYILRKKV